MVFILGRNFPDTLAVRKVLTSLYGISGTSSTLRALAPHSPLSTVTSTSSSSPSTPSPTLSPARHNLLSRLLAQHYIHPFAKLNELAESQLNALVASLSQLTIENDLRRKVKADIQRLRDMGSYRGRRHALGLPVRGQRTRGQIVTARLLNKIKAA